MTPKNGFGSFLNVPYFSDRCKCPLKSEKTSKSNVLLCLIKLDALRPVCRHDESVK